MSINKLGYKYSANDVRNFDAVRCQFLQLDHLPLVSDLDPDNATKSGLHVTGYKDLTGGSVYYKQREFPVMNPVVDSQFIMTNLYSPVGPDKKIAMARTYATFSSYPVPEYIQTTNNHRDSSMSSILTQINQFEFLS